MSSLTMEDFPAFFEAVNGFRPFLWQVRLLDRVLADGTWPAVIDSPTGSGKTSVIDVHVFANALTALGHGRTRVPRRLVVTVDRRALVDDNYEKARALARALQEGLAADGILRTVAEALSAMRPTAPTGLDADEAGPLGVERLRGGLPPGRDWLDDPAGCQVITATPDMWGSRILFGGYGSTRFARPREAGLLAFDTAVVVDEAHLNGQLLVTARQVAALVEREARLLGLPPLQVTAMSATSTIDDRAIGVLPADLSEDGDVLRSRLLADKPLQLHPTESAAAAGRAGRSQLADECVGQVIDLLGEVNGPVGCIVNTVALAVEVATRLSRAVVPAESDRLSSGKAPRVETIVGRMRPHDVHQIRHAQPGLFRLGGISDVDVVVATQTLEVGVDMDLAGLVTELAPGTSLAQRAGRVNRSGRRDSAPIVVVVPTDTPALLKIKGPYDVADLGDAFEWLTTLANGDAALAPWSIHPRGGGYRPPSSRPRRPVFHRPERWNVDYWSRTSETRFAAPEYELWLDDDLSPDLLAGLVVRQGMPRRPTEAVAQTDAAPVAAHEVFPVPLGTLRQVLTDMKLTFDDGTPRYILEKSGDYVYPDPANPVSLRPGDVVVVDAELATFTEGVVTAEGTQTCADVADRWPVDVAYRRRAVRVGLHTPLLAGRPEAKDLLGRLHIAVTRAEDADAALERVVSELRSWIVSADGSRGSEGARDSLRHLLAGRDALALTTAPAEVTDSEDFWLVISGPGRVASDDDLRQVSTPRPGPVGLDEHAQAVADAARALGWTLGLPPGLTEVLREAGARHDDGKADPRFQRALRPHVGAHDGRTLAKSGMRSRQVMDRARTASGLPAGWRHEQFSAALTWEKVDPDDGEYRDLVTRLVGTSHGRGRSSFDHDSRGLLGSGSDGLAGAVELFDEGRWESLVERTDHAWGTWGCAYLEAVLRAADCTTSRRGS